MHDCWHQRPGLMHPGSDALCSATTARSTVTHEREAYGIPWYDVEMAVHQLASSLSLTSKQAFFLCVYRMWTNAHYLRWCRTYKLFCSISGEAISLLSPFIWTRLAYALYMWTHEVCIHAGVQRIMHLKSNGHYYFSDNMTWLFLYMRRWIKGTWGQCVCCLRCKG